MRLQHRVFLAFFILSAIELKAAERKSLESLEKEYWRKKDDTPTVVQNRRFEKKGRFSLSASGGYLVNDPFLQGTAQALEASYFFQEQHGISLSHETFSMTGNKAFEFLEEERGLIPDHNRLSTVTHLSYNFFPIYGKLSFLSSKIVYYDLGLSVGASQVNYSQQMREGDEQLSTMGFHFDIKNYFYVSQSVALLVHIRNVWSNQERVKHSVVSGNDRSLGSSLIHNTQLHLGVAYFLD